MEERIVLKQDSCQLKKMCQVATGITGEQVSGAPWLSGLECRSLNRKVLRSNPTGAVSNLGQVRLPHVA